MTGLIPKGNNPETTVVKPWCGGSPMSTVVESLLEIIKADPLPSVHTSSHWQQHGRDTIVTRRGEELIFQASGFETVVHPRLRGRLLQLAEQWSYRSVTSRLKHFSKFWRITRWLLRNLEGGPDFYAFKSACALATLADHWVTHRLSPKVFVLIGDGYGLLGALVRRYLPGTRLYCIDLPKMLAFQARTHHLADPEAPMSVHSLNGREARAGEIIFVLPQDIEQIPVQIDCAINIASMQEMNEFSINAYFTFLRRRSTIRSRFYSVNRLRNELPGGEVASFADYPWSQDDEIFLDGPCPYYARYFSRQKRPNGPKVLGVRVPFVNYFDGVIMHRLLRLAPLA